MNVTLALFIFFSIFYTQNSIKAQNTNSFPRKFDPYYSQSGQDNYVNEHIFHNKRNGVFVEIGAHDGISFSNTYYFEKELGWKGICIEPNPALFGQLLHNRTAICVNACVSNYNGTASFLKISGYSEMLSGLYDSYDQCHLHRIQAELLQFGGSHEIIQVPVININDLLLEHNMTHIDLLSCDTEGNELAILSAIDFTKIDIEIIVVEDPYGKDHIYNYLVNHGYRYLVRLEGDGIYQKIKE